MIVVSDTTPISELAKVGHLNLLGELYGQVLIPQEVFNEVTTGSHPAVAVVPSLSWIEVCPATDPERVSLSISACILHF